MLCLRLSHLKYYGGVACGGQGVCVCVCAGGLLCFNRLPLNGSEE